MNEDKLLSEALAPGRRGSTVRCTAPTRAGLSCFKKSTKCGTPCAGTIWSGPEEKPFRWPLWRFEFWWTSAARDDRGLLAVELFVTDRAAIDVYGLVAAGVRVVDVLSLAGGMEKKVRELFGKDILARVLVEDLAALRFGRALVAVETKDEASTLLSAGASWWRGKEEQPEQGNDPDVILHVSCMGKMHRLAVRAGRFVALDHTREELELLGGIGENLPCVNLDGMLVTWTGLPEKWLVFSRRSQSWLQRYARYESHATVWTPRRRIKAGEVSELYIEPSLLDSPSICLARTKPKKTYYRADRDYELIRRLSDAVSGMEVRWSHLAPVVYALHLEKEAARWESVVVADPARALLA